MLSIRRPIAPWPRYCVRLYPVATLDQVWRAVVSVNFPPLQGPPSLQLLGVGVASPCRQVNTSWLTAAPKLGQIISVMTLPDRCGLPQEVMRKCTCDRSLLVIGLSWDEYRNDDNNNHNVATQTTDASTAYHCRKSTGTCQNPPRTFRKLL